MVRYRSIIIFVAAITVGITAVVMANRWANQKVAESFTTMLVASRDIAPGERLSSENLNRIDWPKNSIPKGAAQALNLVEGRVAAQPIGSGEPITEGRLAPTGSRAGLNALITPGRRAMTVKVNEIVGVAGFALPGNYVDVLVTVNHNSAPPTARIVLERISVLAVAQDHSVKDETKPRIVSAVTLEVTPEQAEKLDLARSVGTLSLVLRNQTDSAPVVTGGASVADVLHGVGRTASAVTTTPKASGNSGAVEVIRGIQRTSLDGI